MFEKIYKSAVIIIAVFLIGISLYVIISPSKAVSQVSSSKAVSQVSPSATTNYVVPESHVWECISNYQNPTYFILFNRITGECFFISHSVNFGPVKAKLE